MVLDHNYVPPRREEYESCFSKKIEEATEDAPFVIIIRLIIQQVLGFPMYLLNNITAAPTSLAKGKPSSMPFGNSHFAPWGALFRPEEAHLIILSDLGILLMCAALYTLRNSSLNLLLLYVMPYVWCNHWIVAITYLHHTHLDLPKYEPEAWTFIKGATATVDRDLGFVGRFFMHGIVDYHVAHHLFPRAPLYHGKEVTDAIVPVLGSMYHHEKSNFLIALYRTFAGCQYVVSDDKEGKESALWYRGGRSPPMEISMSKKRWLLWPFVF